MKSQKTGASITARPSVQLVKYRNVDEARVSCFLKLIHLLAFPSFQYLF